jgi:hypothetical protein
MTHDHPHATGSCESAEHEYDDKLITTTARGIKSLKRGSARRDSGSLLRKHLAAARVSDSDGHVYRKWDIVLGHWQMPVSRFHEILWEMDWTGFTVMQLEMYRNRPECDCITYSVSNVQTFCSRAQAVNQSLVTGQRCQRRSVLRLGCVIRFVKNCGGG